MLYEYSHKHANGLEQYGQESYSQFGEDVTLWAWLETLGLLQENVGFYCDVGACHPSRGSNTKLLRKYLGWRGINIEPTPELIKEFEVQCPDCVNICAAVGASAGVTKLTVYNHPEVNTTREEMRERQIKSSEMNIIREIQVPVIPLNSVLEAHLPEDKDLTLLTIDAEGMDQEIIESLDFERYAPRLILIEDFQFDLSEPGRSPIFRFLRSKNYIPVCHSMVSTLYRRA